MAEKGVPSAPDRVGRPDGPPQMTLYEVVFPGGQDWLFGQVVSSRDNNGIACT